MFKTPTALTPELHEYLLNVSLQEPPLLTELRQETASLPQAGMQLAPEQAQLLAMLARMVGTRRALEVGTFTGYSALSVASVLPSDGQLIACDVSAEWTSMGRRYWERAGLADKIDLRIAPALDTLKALVADGQVGTFDFAFIDADKRNYLNYYELAMELLRPGGLIVVDNVLWHGRLTDPADTHPDTEAIREFNRSLHADTRIWLSVVPIGDGLTLALKR